MCILYRDKADRWFYERVYKRMRRTDSCDSERRYAVSAFTEIPCECGGYYVQNPYANIYNLQVGDELCIPVGRTGMAENVGKDEDFIKTSGLR